ncbi:MAG TPA: hypothetical protein VD997_17340 [Phycisphaerales bacterium]|nr:hypothetical protein [Phycisphaerales bacterium]
MKTAARVSVAVAALLLAAGAFAQSSITEIPVLPGYTQSTAFGVSADGSMVVGISAPGTNPELVSNPVPMIWTLAGGSQLLPGSSTQPNPSGYCYAVSGDGSKVAGRLGPANIYRWTTAGIESLPTVPGTTMSIALGISRDGNSIVGHSLNSPTKPYIWTPAGGTVVLGGGDTGGTARAVNADGTVVAGGLLINFQTFATRWVDNVSHAFELNGASYAVSGDGLTIVGHITPPGGLGRATRWVFSDLTASPPVATNLGTVPGPSPETRRSLAQGVTDDGQTVVGFALRYVEGGTPTTYPRAAFIWTESTGMVELGTHLAGLGVNMTGWELREAKAISPDGQFIVGTGIHNGQVRGFLARIATGGGNCGTSDFNGDGDFGTDQDIEAFFACIGGHCCDTCWPAGSDFNGDGDAATDQDIEAFFHVLGGGTC